MVSISEVVSFLVLLLSFIVMLIATKKTPKWKYFVSGFIFVLITGITTVAEDFLLHDLMNYIEHISWLGGAIVFCFIAHKFTKEAIV